MTACFVSTRRRSRPALTRTLLLTFAALVWGGQASASMQLDRTQVVFQPAGPGREDVIVRNAGEDTLYLKVEVLEVTAPGTPEERREVVENPESIGLIATPTKLVIQPERRRAIRLVNLQGHDEAERVYRVNVLPVAPPVKAEGMGVRVLIAYQLLVFVRPAESRVDLQVERTGEGLELQNRGNVNILLRDVQHCPDDTATCETLTGLRLYPGNQRLVDVPAGGRVLFNAIADGKTEPYAL